MILKVAVGRVQKNPTLIGYDLLHRVLRGDMTIITMIILVEGNIVYIIYTKTYLVKI